MVVGLEPPGPECVLRDVYRMTVRQSPRLCSKNALRYDAAHHSGLTVLVAIPLNATAGVHYSLEGKKNMFKMLMIAAALSCLLGAAVAGEGERNDVPTKVTIDKHNRFLLNGKPWFPIFFSPKAPPLRAKDPSGRDALAVIREGGVDVFRLNMEGINDPTCRQYLDWAAENHMYTFFFIKEYTEFTPKAPERPEMLRQVIEKYKRHPAVAFWKNIDEPAWGGADPTGMIEAYKEIKKLDTDHPVWTAHAPRNTIEVLREYYDACDMSGLDIYPISVPKGKHSHLPNKEISVVGDYARWINKAVYGKKPFIMILQVCWSGATPPKNELVMPTFHQERFMAYQAIINGSSGLSFFGMSVALQGKDAEYGYNWTFWNEVMAPLLKEVNRDSELYPALVKPDSKIRLKASGAPDVEFCAREVGDRLYIMACKREGAKADITFKGKPLTGEIEVLYENRTLKAKDGSFTDTFGLNDVHVYKVRMK